MVTLLLALLAQDVEIVATSDTLAAPEAKGAIVVSTGGIPARADLAPEGLRSDLDAYLRAAEYRAVGLTARDLFCMSSASVSSAVPKDGHVPVESAGSKFAFVSSEGTRTPGGFVPVLLSEDDPVEVAERMRAHSEVRLALVGGLTSFFGDPIRVAEGQYVVLVPRRGAVRAKLKFEGARLVSVATAAEPFPEEPPAAIRSFCKERGISLRPFLDVLRGAREVKDLASSGLEKLEREGTYPLDLSARNRVVGLRLWSVAIRSEYGACRDVVVLDAEWENAMPLELAFEKKGDASYAMPPLGESLFLVVNGRRLASLHPDAANSAGHVSTRDVKLERIGSTLRGNVAIALPAEPIETLELRFLDSAHGAVSIPIVAQSGRSEERPLAPLQKNESVEAGVYGVRKTKAKEGTALLSVDWRARSVGKTLVEWREVSKAIHLLVDGKESAGVTLPEVLRFLPDAATGEILTFVVPESATSAELRCDFPGLRATPLRFALELR